MTESTWFKKLFYQWKLFCRSARHYFYKNSHTNLVNTIRCLENESEDRIHKYLTAFDIERREYQAEIERLTAELEKRRQTAGARTRHQYWVVFQLSFVSIFLPTDSMSRASMPKS